MIADSDVQIRQMAVKTILDIRTNNSSFELIEIRPFKIPPLRFTAETYVNMIDWEHLLSQNRLLSNTSQKKYVLLNIVCTPMEIPGYPWHTHAVERTIQLVTKALTSVTG